MGRSALARVNLRGNQTLCMKHLAAGITPSISSEGLSANLKLICILGRFCQGQSFLLNLTGCIGCRKGWSLQGLPLAPGVGSGPRGAALRLGLLLHRVIKTHGLKPSA